MEMIDFGVGFWLTTWKYFDKLNKAMEFADCHYIKADNSCQVKNWQEFFYLGRSYA